MPSDRALELHSLTLNDAIDTWDDWKIVSVKKPVFNEPELRAEYADVPGRDGQLDMTEVLTGYPLFENRRGSLEFFLYDGSSRALTKLNRIRNYLHGRKHKIILNDEPEYYYAGRLMMHESHPTTEGEYAVFELEYDLEPYKYEMTSASEDWLWDPFNFETGVIRDYKKIILEYQNTPVVESVTVIGSPKPVPLKVTISVPPVASEYASWAYVKMQYGEDIYYLRAGTKIFPNIMLLDDEYEFEFSLLADPDTGNALAEVYLTIEYRGGSL